jgi:hypothetical protein
MVHNAVGGTRCTVLAVLHSTYYTHHTILAILYPPYTQVNGTASDGALQFAAGGGTQGSEGWDANGGSKRVQ